MKLNTFNTQMNLSVFSHVLGYFSFFVFVVTFEFILALKSWQHRVHHHHHHQIDTYSSIYSQFFFPTVSGCCSVFMNQISKGRTRKRCRFDSAYCILIQINLNFSLINVSLSLSMIFFPKCVRVCVDCWGFQFWNFRKHFYNLYCDLQFFS